MLCCLTTELNSKSITLKKPSNSLNIWKLNHILLNNLLVKDETKKEIWKYFILNYNKYKTYQTL